MPTLTSPEPPEKNDGVAAVDRALHIATALANSPQALTLTELSVATGMYKSTLLRLLASLERAGLVTHRSDKRYALGPLAFVFGRSFEQTHGLQGAIQPILQWLVEQGTESPSFHVRHDQTHRLCIMRIDSNHSTLDRVRIGDLLPLHRGAAGKVITSLEQGPPPSPTASSDLVFTSFGERDPLCGAIAAPVFGPSASLLGAISVSGPLERFSELAVERMKTLVIAAAQRATQSLGGKWPGA
ncbi:IclR family transcriptional regulator [Alicycliphilus denitrificans]|uniref:IclR family transcriptional regulator n=1 Tax=Alicycliphilus denitrificans TaxID=179636 RepID=UPI00095F4E07|nr:helix-turn-helix domain-containing protein [Alicycliphilus denitrificans]MBN9573003.1 helix-turn-helix domain-containing protein [Alicycliphilus denitrificans]OJW93132.1 MAG: IclR family transcriptional regulator [Alicycliphilus sp. 69-12]BCN37027.1 IclR family transcriptional regulator [Alicycliphilus denitrificans]